MRIVIFSFLLLISIPGFAQELFIGYHVEVGTFSPKFAYGGDMLSKAKMPFESSKRLNFSYRHNDLWTFDFSWGGKAYGMHLKDNSVTSQYTSKGIAIYSKAKIGNYQFGIARSGALGKNFYLQLKLSYIRDKVKEANVSESAYIGKYDVDFTATYKKSNGQLTPQVGIEYRLPKGQILRWAINYNINGGTGYAHYTYARKNTVTGTTQTEFLKHKGQYWGMLFGVDFPLIKDAYSGQERSVKIPKLKLPALPKKKEKEPKPVKIKEPKPVKEKEPKPVKVKEPKPVKEKVVKPEKTKPEKVSKTQAKTTRLYKKRKVETMGKFEPQGDTLYISIYDNYTEDGDIVSLFLNDQAVLSEHTLTNKPYQFKVVIPPGKSELVLFAHNLGKVPPNTMGMTVSDGKTQHKIVLNSDFKKNGSLHIDYKK